MKNKLFRLFPVVLGTGMILTACSSSQSSGETSSVLSNAATTTSSATSKSEVTTSASSTKTNASTETEEAEKESTSSDASEEGYFSDRDLSGEYDASEAVEIKLNGDSIEASGDGVTVDGSTVTITKEGTYILSGTLNDGSIIVNTTSEEKVQLVLNGVSITSSDFAPIYVAQADKVFITLADGTENTLTNGGSFTQIDDNTVDAVIFSKDDLTLNGTGSLTISSPAGHGIVSKDEVVITMGTYNINVSQKGIQANDIIAIADGTFDIDAVEGLESTYILVESGTLDITASDDGINATLKSDDYSTPVVEINGGNVTITMGQGDTDGVDSNGDIIINGGTISVTGNSTFDYDGQGVINGGTVIANGSEITELTNQFGGGMGGRGGFGDQGGFGGRGGR